MTINFTKEEEKYIYTVKEDDYKMQINKDTPRHIIKTLQPKVEAFNKWIDEINGVKK